jgi:hypothetical protein
MAWRSGVREFPTSGLGENQSASDGPFGATKQTSRCEPIHIPIDGVVLALTYKIVRLLRQMATYSIKQRNFTGLVRGIETYIMTNQRKRREN